MWYCRTVSSNLALHFCQGHYQQTSSFPPSNTPPLHSTNTLHISHGFTFTADVEFLLQERISTGQRARGSFLTFAFGQVVQLLHSPTEAEHFLFCFYTSSLPPAVSLSSNSRNETESHCNPVLLQSQTLFSWKGFVPWRRNKNLSSNE